MLNSSAAGGGDKPSGRNTEANARKDWMGVTNKRNEGAAANEGEDPTDKAETTEEATLALDLSVGGPSSEITATTSGVTNREIVRSCRERKAAFVTVWPRCGKKEIRRHIRMK